jgi:hypothetical protein
VSEDQASKDEASKDEERRSDRRAFLRRLTGEAVNAAGTLAGTTQIVFRSAAAASEAAAEGLGIREPVEEPATAAADAAPDQPAAPPAPVATPPPAAVATPPPSLRPLTARETDLLSATSAVIAANGSDGIPHLTRAPFHWDGAVARLLGQLFGARVANVQRNGRITVLIEAAAGWVALSGEATVVAGPGAAAEAAPLLAQLYPEETAEVAWARLEAEAMQAVIVLRPTRVVSSTT